MLSSPAREPKASIACARAASVAMPLGLRTAWGLARTATFEFLGYLLAASRAVPSKSTVRAAIASRSNSLSAGVPTQLRGGLAIVICARGGRGNTDARPQ
eukprot:SAG11_NODE_1259_length_5357_cov_34.538227_3_plen_100_part_00